MASMSDASAKVTTEASNPCITLRACLPEPPCDWSIDEGPTLAGFPVAEEGLVVVLVELARRIVGDVEDVGTAVPTACRGKQRQTQSCEE